MAKMQKQVIEQKYVNRINKRFTDLNKRQIKFGVGFEKSRFNKILKQYNIGTKNGKLSTTKLNKLNMISQNAVLEQLNSFMENTTAKTLKQNLQTNKRALRDTFMDAYNIDIGKLSDEQYGQFWDRIHELENEFSDGDYSSENVMIVSELNNDLLNGIIDEDTVDEFFEVIKDVEQGNGVDFLRELQDNGYNFDF